MQTFEARTRLWLGNEALNRAFTGISDALGKFDTYSKDVRLSNILNQTTGPDRSYQLRAAIAGADRSGSGAAQFAALENMLSGRIGQARDQEALSQALKINPLLLTEQVIKNDTGQEKLIDLRLRNPLERNEIAPNRSVWCSGWCCQCQCCINPTAD